MKIRSKFIFAITTWTFTLIFVELLVRLVAPQFDPSGMIEYQINSDGVPLLRRKGIILRQWKNTGDYDVEIYSNELGLRNRADFSKASKNALYVVGDSFAFGHGVKESERFSDLLHKMGVGEIVNIAIPTDIKGYQSLIDYAISHGANINKVILTLCVENDIQDYSRTDAIDTQRNLIGLTSLKIFLMTHSALYNLLTTAIHQNHTLNLISQSLGFSKRIEDSVGGSDLSESEILSTINQLKYLVSKYHAKFLIVIIPPRSLWIGSNTSKAQLRYDYLIKELKEGGFMTLDLRPDFERQGNPMQYHFKFDGHWNSAGHEMAAEQIKKTIIESNF